MSPRTPREVVRVRPDLNQLRVLAHPVRLKMLGMLRNDGPATASGLAARLGLNSGATSYHLRQLADVGLIEDDEGRGNGRERWWRATHSGTLTEPSEVDDPDERAVLGSYHAVVAHEAATQIELAAAEAAELPREWADSVTASDWNFSLTVQELEDLKERVQQLITEAADKAITRSDPPEGAESVVLQFHVFPRPGTLTHRDES